MIGVPVTQGRPQPGVAGQHTADSVLFVLVFYCLNCFVLFLIGFVFYGFFFLFLRREGKGDEVVWEGLGKDQGERICSVGLFQPTRRNFETRRA